MEYLLYYNDPYIKQFTARILHQAQDSDGRWYAVLNQTAFYPTGGGQPCDTGLLGDVAVTDVEEVEGEVRHYLANQLPDTPSDITGTIDWTRRFDHMQQHTGQHILSAAFEELFAAATIGFHMGQESVTIDLAIDELTQGAADQAEERANQIVFENRNITAHFVEPQELEALPLRKRPSVTENIRIVTVENFDYSPCGGTHPTRTGEVGPIIILGWERYKGQIRLTFICGARTVRACKEKHLILRELSRLLSSAEENLSKQAERILASQKENERALRDMREQLLAVEAKTLLEQAAQKGSIQLVANVLSGRTIQEMQKLARLITEQEASSLVLLVATKGERVQFICARGDHPLISANELTKAALPYINGKGGGNPKMAQGGGQTERSAEEVLAHLIELGTEKIW
ncbi:alanyl-tRNA editing protein [Aneurinibacillus sp. REN35]|uniref:alanyl-tRNA editing protein n=1 Tax=Aneurinibacillus sp. REN35 TaxID=3237286 RepID=UPI0035274709